MFCEEKRSYKYKHIQPATKANKQAKQQQHSRKQGNKTQEREKQKNCKAWEKEQRATTPQMRNSISSKSYYFLTNTINDHEM